MEQQPLYKYPLDNIKTEAQKRVDNYKAQSKENEETFNDYSLCLAITTRCSEHYLILDFVVSLEKKPDERVKNYLFFIKNRSALGLTQADVDTAKRWIQRIMLSYKKTPIEDYLDFLVGQGVLKFEDKSTMREIINKELITDPLQLAKVTATFQQIQEWIKKYENDFGKLPNPLAPVFKRQCKEIYKRICTDKFDYAYDAKNILDFWNKIIESIKSISVSAYAELKSILVSYEQDLTSPTRTPGSKEPELD